MYRARDEKLGREVAIKVLPEGVLADPERRARFEREARVLASLNHPHIGAIYGIEESDGLSALVLELVEGPTLAERLQKSAMAIEEALAIAGQVAEAALCGARFRNRPSGPETGEHQDQRPGTGEAPGLWRRVTGAAAECRQLDDVGGRPDERRTGYRNRRVHVPGASARCHSRWAIRSVLFRHRPVRNAHGQEPVRAKQRGGNTGLHSPGQASADRPAQSLGARAASMAPRPVPGEGPKRSLCVHERPGEGSGHTAQQASRGAGRQRAEGSRGAAQTENAADRSRGRAGRCAVAAAPRRRAAGHVDGRRGDRKDPGWRSSSPPRSGPHFRAACTSCPWLRLATPGLLRQASCWPWAAATPPIAIPRKSSKSRSPPRANRYSCSSTTSSGCSTRHRSWPTCSRVAIC